MKIWNWIDGTLLNTSFRRRQLLGAMVRLYWLWQCIWIAVLLFRLTSVQSYDSLFSLQASWMNGTAVSLSDCCFRQFRVP